MLSCDPLWGHWQEKVTYSISRQRWIPNGKQFNYQHQRYLFLPTLSTDKLQTPLLWNWISPLLHSFSSDKQSKVMIKHCKLFSIMTESILVILSGWSLDWHMATDSHLKFKTVGVFHWKRIVWLPHCCIWKKSWTKSKPEWNESILAFLSQILNLPCLT